jgi:hypothetical protein
MPSYAQFAHTRHLYKSSDAELQLQESSQCLPLALLSVVKRSKPKLPTHGHFKQPSNGQYSF